MSRRKGSAVPAPSTYAEAVAIAGAYGSEERRIANIKVFTERRIAEMKAAADAEIAKTAEGQSMRFAQLKAWWAVASADVAKGKKSAELGGITLGVRTSTPKLTLPKGLTVVAALDSLMGWLGGDFIRTKHELDKEAIIKCLRTVPAKDDQEGLHDLRVLRDEVKFAVSQKDEFFIQVGEPKPAPIVEQEAE